MSEASSSPRSVSSSAPSSTSGPRSEERRAANQPLTGVSVLYILQTLPLTAAGRPALFGNEVEIYSEEKIGLYDRTFKTPHIHGRCSVTTHRLFYMDESSSPPVAFFLPLDWIVRLTKEAGFLQRSAKLRVDITTRPPSAATSFLKLSFKDGGRDDFYSPLAASLKRQAWKDTQPSHLADRRLMKRHFDAADAGIAGIMRRQQEAQKETMELATTAFSDLTNLMIKAKDMVGLIERYVDMQRATELAEEDGMTSSEADMNKLSSLMLDMGITSPVTRANSGTAYYEQLARQLAEYLRDHMPRNGGIMTLSDIYCMFNRARGVELVSPDDLYHAAVLQKKLNLGCSMRKFPSGLIVLQTDTHSEDKVAERLAKMAQKSSFGYITSTDVSVEMHTSFPLAQEYLHVAEKLGKLCRDETFEGINFYPNMFEQFVVTNTEVE